MNNFDQENIHNIFVKSSTGFYVSPESVQNGVTVSAIKLMLDNSYPLPVSNLTKFWVTNTLGS